MRVLKNIWSVNVDDIATGVEQQCDRKNVINTEDKQNFSPHFYTFQTHHINHSSISGNTNHDKTLCTVTKLYNLQ